VTLSLAAGLAELTARVSGATELAARARALREEVAPLAGADAEAYEAFQACPEDVAARERTIAVPLRMAELAAEIAEAAALAFKHGRGVVRADAAAGALFAEAAAKAAANLVAVNLGNAADERRERAREYARRASAAAARAAAD
jgi:methenyltetrahydrofolate cyclohydrolase